GQAKMRDFGSLLAFNDIVPARIVVSEWCRNQQTLDALREGYARVDPSILGNVPVATRSDLNLLLSLQGAENVSALRDLVSAWDGDPDRSGPLLIATHFTNIEELTQFSTFEGEIIVLDPKCNNRVLGTLRLNSASPDVGHFADMLVSPLLYEDQATDMVSRYCAALNNDNRIALENVLAPDWTDKSMDGSATVRDATGFLSELSEYRQGLAGARFEVDEVKVAYDTVTVIGTITETHEGKLFGVEPTGRSVSFGAIAVYRIQDGQIIESWQMPDKDGLLDQILQ
ncbi:MAG: ester cyclase, partial [Litorimonas sp.]